MIVLPLKKFADLKQYLHIVNLVNKYCIDDHGELNSRKSFGKEPLFCIQIEILLISIIPLKTNVNIKMIIRVEGN